MLVFLLSATELQPRESHAVIRLTEREFGRHYFIKNVVFDGLRQELRPRERSHKLRDGRLIHTIPKMSSAAPMTAELCSLIIQHTPRVLQHTFGLGMLTGSLQLPFRTPIHCVQYWGKLYRGAAGTSRGTLMRIINCWAGNDRQTNPPNTSVRKM